MKITVRQEYMGFNVAYLLDVLNVMGSEQVVLETTTAFSPMVIKPVGENAFIHVIMPMYVLGVQ